MFRAVALVKKVKVVRDLSTSISVKIHVAGDDLYAGSSINIPGIKGTKFDHNVDTFNAMLLNQQIVIDDINALKTNLSDLKKSIATEARKKQFQLVLRDLCSAYKLRIVIPALWTASEFDYIPLAKNRTPQKLLPYLSVKCQKDFLEGLPVDDPRRIALQFILPIPPALLETTTNTIKVLDKHIATTSTQLSTELVYKTAAVLNLTHHSVLRLNTADQLQEFIVEAAKYPPTDNESDEEREVYNKAMFALKKDLNVMAYREQLEQQQEE